ncbi:hypothetical protein FJ955_12245 [Mesorhizobium sp. B2-2-2]|nr:hypothetical protein FJ955_12245 [Mesorhizobium sp. B2-2-2]
MRWGGRAAERIECSCDWRSATHDFVIHGRSKERSDAAQTRGSMLGLQRATTVQNSAPLHFMSRSRHGASGLRDGASLLLRPWMTTLVGTKELA